MSVTLAAPLTHLRAPSRCAGGCARPFVPSSSVQQRSNRSAAARRRIHAAAAGGNGSAAAAPEVKAVLFDMDGVLCDSEHISREAACAVMKELYGLNVRPEEFAEFTGRGEAAFLGGVALRHGAPFEVDSCKAKFYEIYMRDFCVPGAGIGCPGALELVQACRAAGLQTAVASSADRVKVDANLAAAGIPQSLFNAVVSADAFERLKPSPDIFLAAAAAVGVQPANCVVIEDAVAGVQAAQAAGMRVVGVLTSLPRAELEAAAPDAILPATADVSLEVVTGLQYRDARLAAAAAGVAA